MKKVYEEPIIEIQKIEVEDIITSSANGLSVIGTATDTQLAWGKIK